jgi:LDH2 family malate/lactate/ureidoglycolate dehydrogenase
MIAKEKNIPAEALALFVAAVFADAGCPEAEAAEIAQCLVQTNLWGIDSHGVIRVPEYLARFRSGAMNTTPDIKTATSNGALEVLDADNGAGYVAGRVAMARAIELARRSAIAGVGIINSNHCGATALYARMAAEEGMVGIAMTNVAPNMVMPGVSKPITGNNPIAVAIPTFGEFPFVLDISLSAVAGGKLLVAARKGEKIPLGWATDKEGQPTTDAQAGFDGYLLPMGGHKGFGLSLMVDLLCGVITGGAFQNQIKSMYRYPDDPSRTAHLMLVMNPLVLMNKEQLKNRAAEFVKTLKQTPAVHGGAEILLPGEIEYRTERVRRRDGIPLPAAVFEELTRIGNEINRSIENE